MKDKSNSKKGISLIVLIITIVVIIILAAAVIVTLANNNPVEDAKKAILINDVSELKNQLTLYIGKQYLNAQGSFNIASLDGKKLEEVVTETPEKYAGKFVIQNGEIVGTDQLTKQEKEWLEGIIGNSNEEGSSIPTPTGGSIYTDSNGVKVPIPQNFIVSTVDGENTVANGLIIKSGSNGAAADTDVDEFVWVPVDDINEMCDSATSRGKLYDFSAGRVSTLIDNCLTTTVRNREPAIVKTDGDPTYDMEGITQESIQNEFNTMITSVQKFGGFYIGRFETGNLASDTVVVRKGNTDITDQTWYTMYSKLKAMVSSSSAQSSMIWGSQWDATLRWINKDNSIGDYVTDSSEKGNFSGHVVATGTSESYKVKNIYDMAGNVHDWTIEANSLSDRVLRGGIFNSSTYNRYAAYRVNTVSTSSQFYIGVRAQLYLK